jgi:hypothetical protein
MYPTVVLLEETKGGGKEGNNLNTNESHHICVETGHRETH